MNATTLTEQFVDKVLAVNYRSLPQAAIDMAKQVTLDGIAVTIAGATEPLGVGRISMEYVKEIGGAPQASVIGGGFKSSMQDAAYANGTMAHALDFDNTWYPLNHPTSPTLPAILAIAEHHRLNGAKVIEAIVAAFEVQARVRLAATGMADGSGFHKPGTTGTFGATAAAVKLLALGKKPALMAFGIAGSRAGSLSINTGTMTKSSHAGHAARMGVEAGVLAKLGWTANPDVFGPGGFFDTFLGGKAEPGRLIEGFGEPFRMVEPGVGFKKYPCNYFTHRLIDAALALRQEARFEPREIEAVDIVFPRFDYVNRPQPASGLDGKFSVQYTTAVALLDGEVTVDSFTNERRYAPDAVDLLRRVKLRFDDAIPRDFDRMHIVVTVSLGGGRSFSKKIDRLSGWVGFPLAREERLKKFHSCARRLLPKAAAERVIALVEGLEGLPDVREIMDILRGEP